MKPLTSFCNIGALIQIQPGPPPRLTVKRRCALLVRDGRIEKVVPDSRAALKKASRTIDLGGKAVIPGLVDCHTHLIYGGCRKDEMEQRLAGASYMDILQQGGGILNTVRATRKATEEALFESARQRMRRMMTLGTTAFEIKSGYGLDLKTEMKILRVGQRLRKALRAPVTLTYLGAHAVPQGETTEGYFQFVMDHLQAFRDLADGVDIFCERGVFSVGQLKRLFERARQLGFPQLRAHVEELSHQGGSYHAAQLGAMSCDHLEYAMRKDIRAMAGAGCTAVLMPGVTCFLGGKKLPRVQDMLEAGVNIALATDCNPGSCPTYNMQTVLGLAMALYRLTPERALIAGTHGSARALGGDGEFGGLLEGQRADFAVLKTADYRDLFYYFGENFVAETYLAGRKIKPEKIPAAD